MSTPIFSKWKDEVTVTHVKLKLNDFLIENLRFFVNNKCQQNFWTSFIARQYDILMEFKETNNVWVMINEIGLFQKKVHLFQPNTM